MPVITGLRDALAHIESYIVRGLHLLKVFVILRSVSMGHTIYYSEMKRRPGMK